MQFGRVLALMFAACPMAADNALAATAAGDDNSPTGLLSTPSANPLWGVPLRMLSATQQRPIFSAARRPPSPPVAAVAAPPLAPPPPPQAAAPDFPPLTLVGTISGNSAGIGVFAEASTARTIRIKTSESYAGWTLLAVTRREAMFQSGDRKATMTFPLPTHDESRPLQPAQNVQALQQAQTRGSSPARVLPAWLRAEDVQLNPSASAQSPGSELDLPLSPTGASPVARPSLKR